MPIKRLSEGLLFMDQDLACYVLLSDSYVKEHSQICSLLTQNGLVVISSNNTNQFYKFAAKAAKLALTKLYLDNSPSASHDPLAINIDPIYRETVSLLIKENTRATFIPKRIVQKSEIFTAFDQGALKILKKLLSLQVNAPFRNFERDRAGLFLFFIEGNVEPLVDFILKRDSSLINARSSDEETPLMISAELGHYSAVNLLLKKGADINLKCGGLTALHFAAYQAHIEIVKLLIENGANPHGGTNESTTPLFAGISSGCLEVVDFFLKVGVSANQRNDMGKSALHVASSARRPQIVQYLLKHGADVNATFESRTPIFNAVEFGAEETIELRYNFGADVIHKDKDAKTILHVCLSRYELDVLFKYLLETCFFDFELLKRSNIFEKLLTFFVHRLLYREQVCSKILIFHVIKLETLNPSVASPYHSYEVGKFSEFKNQCQVEVAKMKTEQLGTSSVSCLTFLIRNVRHLARYCRNESVVKMQEGNYINTAYPIFGNLILNQIRKGYFRKKLLDRGVTCLGQLTASKVSSLPYNIREEILQYLSNREILVFENILINANVLPGF